MLTWRTLSCCFSPKGQISLHGVPWTEYFSSPKGQISWHDVPWTHCFLFKRTNILTWRTLNILFLFQRTNILTWRTLNTLFPFHEDKYPYMMYLEHRFFSSFASPKGQISFHDIPWTHFFFSSKGQISLHAVPLKHMFFSFLFFSPKERYPFMAYLKDTKFFVPDALSITRIGRYRNCRYPVALVKLFVKILTRSARHYVQHFPTQWTPVETRGEKTPVILMCTLSVSSLLNWSQSRCILCVGAIFDDDFL